MFATADTSREHGAVWPSLMAFRRTLQFVNDAVDSIEQLELLVMLIESSQPLVGRRLERGLERMNRLNTT